MSDQRDMWRAISGGKACDVRFLLDNGVDANLSLGDPPFDRPALDVAAEFLRADICRLLIERGADPLGSPVKGRIPVKTAAGQFLPATIRLPTVQLLLEVGADANAMGPDDEWTALATAMATRQGGEDLTPLVELMVRYGGDLNFVPGDAQPEYLTPVQRAVMGANANLMRFVLSRDEVDPFQKTLKGRSLLQLCVRNTCVEARTLIVEARATWRAKATQVLVESAVGARQSQPSSATIPQRLRRSAPAL
jgi:hypothetical protein